MKKQYEVAGKLLEIFGETTFYVVTVYGYNVKAQGNYDSSLAKSLKAKGYTGTISDNGYMEFEGTIDGVDINITLT